METTWNFDRSYISLRNNFCENFRTIAYAEGELLYLKWAIFSSKVYFSSYLHFLNPTRSFYPRRGAQTVCCTHISSLGREKRNFSQFSQNHNFQAKAFNFFCGESETGMMDRFIAILNSQ